MSFRPSYRQDGYLVPGNVPPYAADSYVKYMYARYLKNLNEDQWGDDAVNLWEGLTQWVNERNEFMKTYVPKPSYYEDVLYSFE